jgi:hypothetical protein
VIARRNVTEAHAGPQPGTVLLAFQEIFRPVNNKLSVRHCSGNNCFALPVALSRVSAALPTRNGPGPGPEPAAPAAGALSRADTASPRAVPVASGSGRAGAQIQEHKFIQVCTEIIMMTGSAGLCTGTMFKSGHRDAGSSRNASH